MSGANRLGLPRGRCCNTWRDPLKGWLRPLPLLVELRLAPALLARVTQERESSLPVLHTLSFLRSRATASGREVGPTVFTSRSARWVLNSRKPLTHELLRTPTFRMPPLPLEWAQGRDRTPSLVLTRPLYRRPASAFLLTLRATWTLPTKLPTRLQRGPRVRCNTWTAKRSSADST